MKKPLVHGFAALLSGLLAVHAMPAFAAAGDLDTTFGSGGKVTTPIGTTEDQCLALGQQTDGKILAGGSAATSDGTTDFALVRYTTAGALDTSFGSGGKVTTAISTGNDIITGMAVQPDGRVVVCGSTTSSAVARFVIARYNPGGSLDSSFGTNGFTITNFSSGSCAPASIVMQPDGKFVVGGYTFQGATNGKNNFALARYDSSGDLDTSFGTGGLVNTDFSGSDDMVGGLALQPDGKIVAGGVSGASAAAAFAVARYDRGGNLDTTFGSGGLATASFPGGAATGTCVAVQGNGRILVGGYCQPTPVSFALARFTTAGVLDSSFGSSGLVTTSVSTSAAQAYAITFQKGGLITLAGKAFMSLGYDFALVRYTNSGRLDTSFGGGDGIVTTSFDTTDEAHALLAQSDGKLVAGGLTRSGAADFALARYSAGTVDLAPQITGFYLSAAPIGYTLFISGYNFLGASSVAVGSTLKPQNFSVLNNGQIAISNIASGTDSGQVRVTTGKGTALSTDSWHLLPNINSFLPTSGPVGTLVTITGTGFRISSGQNVDAIRFSGPNGTYISGTKLTVISRTQATVRVPTGAITGPLRARNAYGATQTGTSFRITAGAAVPAGPSSRTSQVPAKAKPRLARNWQTPAR